MSAQKKKGKPRKFKAVVTRRGDGGSTSLLFGGRVKKYHPQPEAYGTFDEVNSALGLARSLCTETRLKEILYTIQQDTFAIGAELATDPKNLDRLAKRITEDDLDRLEGTMFDLEDEVEIGRQFITPGDTPAGAALDLARTIVRRGERQLVKLHEDGLLKNEAMLSYVNRLSDCLFFLARYEEQHQSG